MPLSKKWKPRIPQFAKVEGEFLEVTLPMKALGHLTTSYPRSMDRLAYIFRAWILDLQRHHGATLGWVRTIERSPQPHIHVALVCSVPIDCDYAVRSWRRLAAPRYFDAARVEPYRRCHYGIAYVLKQLECSATAIQCSDNISAFALGAGESRFPTTPTQRRQYRRIKAQLKQESAG